MTSYFSYIYLVNNKYRKVNNDLQFVCKFYLVPELQEVNNSSVKKHIDLIKKQQSLL